MLYSLNAIIFTILRLFFLILSFSWAFDTASWYFHLKSGKIFDFLVFMGVENSALFSIVVFFVSFAIYGGIFKFIAELGQEIGEILIYHFSKIITISLFGILSFPFVFLYTFLFLPLKHCYIFIRYRRILFHIKFWNLYPFIFLTFFGIVGFLFYYFNVFDFLKFEFKEISNFILSLKKFPYFDFFHCMFLCFILNIICFIFALFFNKIEKILYIKMFNFAKNEQQERNKQDEFYEEKTKEKTQRKQNSRNDKLAFACKIFSINIEDLDKMTQKDLKLKYHKLARMFHPDANQGNEKEANEKMKDINNSYDFLKQYIKD